MWDPATQTYTDGIVPSHHSAMDIADLLKLNQGKLKIFGYGSLCWHPGSDGVLSLANIEEDEHDHDDDADADDAIIDNDNVKVRRKVTTAPGRAIGYQRCWSQRSADHRGTPKFNGIVCTLLSDEEVWKLHNDGHGTRTQRPSISMTEGLIYTVDEDLADDCLAELDFREKGGYARDVIDVVEDDTGKTVKALLYRGTPDNPAFWKRVLLDLPLAAAIMSVAIGPSGPNDIYLLHLHTFLAHAAQHSSSAAMALEDHSGDVHTGELAEMVKLFQSEFRPYFLFGAGSNEHEQLMLSSGSVASKNSYIDVDGEVESSSEMEHAVNEVHELTELLLVAPRESDYDDNGTGNANHEPKSLHAGGGHSALLTHGGSLYLWGWNEAGQLGRAKTSKSDQGDPNPSRLKPVQPLSNIKVEAVDLGHTHTLVIEKNTGRLFGFGENGRGQVNGQTKNNGGGSTNDLQHTPITPIGLEEERFVDVASGLFHSAAITNEGELVTWGCGRFGQCLRPTMEIVEKQSTVARWRPADGSKLEQVACGRRHTVVLDEHGRIWTLGDNKYGQLGRSTDSNTLLLSNHAEPQLVEGPLGQINSGCFALCSGWSHILALTRDSKDSEVTSLYGWGRNDKGQLGSKPSQGKKSPVPQLLEPLPDSKGSAPISIQSACCGSESSHVLNIDGSIFSTGWNEHGNLAIGHQDKKSNECCLSWMTTSGVRVVAPPSNKSQRRLFAAGGAHMIILSQPDPTLNLVRLPKL